MSSRISSLSGSDERVIIGLRVMNVQSGCVAERLGIMAGDVVVSVDGQPVRCPWQLAANIATCGPNEERVLRVYHPTNSRMETIRVDGALITH